MSKIIQIPKFLVKDKDPLEYGAEYVKTFFNPKSISLPSEYEFYLKKFKRVYKIEKSNSTLSYVLTVDDGTMGWGQKGWYVRRLKGYKLQEALADAILKYPEEAAFFCEDGMEYKSNDPNFDKLMKDYFGL